MFVLKRNGNKELVHFDKITDRIDKLIKINERKYIDASIIAQKVVATIFCGITTEELDYESAKICINMCTQHYLYSSLAARILISNLHKKTLNTFVEKQIYIQNKLNILDNDWLKWICDNKDEINSMINYNNDYIFDYFGFKTLERAYLITVDGIIIERPQDMFMRVASFINKGNLILIKKTYDLMSNGLYTHATPTLFNSGNKQSQMSSCFLLGTEDSLNGITKTWADVSSISKWGGGIGLHISDIRSKYALIKGTNGPSNGIIPMLKVYNEIARYVNQCFEPNTPICTDKGYIFIKDVKPNNKVLTNDGSFCIVKRLYCDYFEGSILNISTNNTIKVTFEHPFLSFNTNSNDIDIIKNKLSHQLIIPEWIEAKNLTMNHYISIPIPQYELDNYYITDLDCYIYGLILIGGVFTDCKIILTINNDLCNLVSNYFSQLNINYIYNNNTFTWNYTSKFKFTRAQFDNIDSSILHLPLNKVKWFIKSIIDTFGFTINTEKYDLNFINNLQYILTRFGVLCNYCNNILYIPKETTLLQLLEYNIIPEPVTFILFNNMLFTKVQNIHIENVNTTIYDLEVENNHNYLTIGGLVHNGGKRKGSIAIYLEPHHPEIMNFLDLRKNFGTETERTRDLFLALWISDLFMKQVESNGDWYLLCPNKCPGLTEVYGEEYEKLYWNYVNNNMYLKKIKAQDVMKAILESQIETGMPYMCYKDNINNKSNQKNIGTIKSSNLCAEIVEYSSHDEYAVCNLASIAINKFVKPYIFNNNDNWVLYTKDNCKYCTFVKTLLKNNNIQYTEIKNQLPPNTKTYPQVFINNILIGGYNEVFYYTKGTFDFKELYNVAYIATLNLNNIIDINFYPVIETKKSNLRHRPIGLGIQGLADTLVLLKINFDSDESIEFNKKMMETIYLAALTASNDIAKSRYQDVNEFINSNIPIPEYYDKYFNIDNSKLNDIYHSLKLNKCELNNNGFRSGSYSTFDGSPISNGLFQFDLWNIDRNTLYYKTEWTLLEALIKLYGVRNSLVTALMPTASTSQILGNNECFEFFTNNIYTRRTLAGDFPLINKYLIDELINLDLWSIEMKQMIIANNGSIAIFNNIPEQIRKLYKNIWEIKQIWILKNAVARGPFIDQTQSMNIFMNIPDNQKLYSSHVWSWKNGLKTGLYYLRSKPSKDAIKITINPELQQKIKNITQNEDECLNCSA